MAKSLKIEFLIKILTDKYQLKIQQKPNPTSHKNEITENYFLTQKKFIYPQQFRISKINPKS